ncbi:hypothetical protein ACVGVM_14545 [Pseudonocardia bannensis]|uniref:Small CPxCG-related zinc finger protein n=1 Tax=Pseudonocardia bannensis TaxID=630973 RepID=A0A848DQR7_9PSEU|nr:hypothetical protein [Pseudonocardia bannensis]NMH94863.1 hypothetical protein [Pseudonocardia bannensis]
MESAPVSCSLCGDVRDPSDPAALAWAGERDERGRDRWLCPGCTRRHTRDIEARLPVEWW